jgi:glycosyltransferase involved in cell wall biosynthesis
MRRVDVVIPCYNYARYLPQCVASVLGQQTIDARALIIDDCSSDDTPRIATALAAADARVEFRRHIDTYNEGLLEWANGDYVLLFSADDVLTPGALARAVDAMEAHPEVGMAYGAEVTFEDKLPALPPTDRGRAPYDIIAGRDLIETCCISADNPVGPTAVLRTSLQRIVGGYRKDMAAHRRPRHVAVLCGPRLGRAN